MKAYDHWYVKYMACRSTMKHLFVLLGWSCILFASGDFWVMSHYNLKLELPFIYFTMFHCLKHKFLLQLCAFLVTVRNK